MLVERMGVKVKMVMSSYFNIKITTNEDLVFAEAIARSLRSDDTVTQLKTCIPSSRPKEVRPSPVVAVMPMQSWGNAEKL